MSSTNIKDCSLYTNNVYKGRIRKIFNKTDIPEKSKNIISINMLLCQTYYNQYILNELSKIKSCQHPKHNIYESTSTNLTKIPKRLIEVLELDENSMICSMCRKRTDNDLEYLQNEKYKAPIARKTNLNDDDNLQNELIKTENKINKNLIKIPKRLIELLGLDEFAMICSICRKRTDRDSEYLEAKEYEAPISRKNNNEDNILKIGNHNYSFRKDILYTGKELKQFESDYQEIIAELTISNEINLSSKIIKMSNILYNNQHRLNQKPIYDPIAFKSILEIADKDLVGFFDELFIGTNPNTKNNKTNENNKKN